MQIVSCDTTTTLNWDGRNMHILKPHCLWKKIFFFSCWKTNGFLGPLKDKVLYDENSVVYSSTFLNT